MSARDFKDQLEPLDTLPPGALPDPVRPTQLPVKVLDDDGEVEPMYLSVQDQTRIVAGYLGHGNDPVWCSRQDKTPRGRVQVYNALAGQVPRLVDQVNRSLDLVDVIVHARRCLTEQGEMLTGPRVVILCADGTAYFTSGIVPLNAIKRMMDIVGMPTWAPAMPVRVVPWKGQAKDGHSVMLEVELDLFVDRCDGVELAQLDDQSHRRQLPQSKKR